MKSFPPRFFSSFLQAVLPESLRKEPGTTPSVRIPSVSPYPALKRALDDVLPDTLFPPSNAAVKIISLTEGETLYDLNGTGAHARVQPETLHIRMRAERARAGIPLPDARLSADTSAPPRIIVRGSGDPILSTKDLDTLAAAIRNAASRKSSWTRGRGPVDVRRSHAGVGLDLGRRTGSHRDVHLPPFSERQHGAGTRAPREGAGDTAEWRSTPPPPTCRSRTRRRPIRRVPGAQLRYQGTGGNT
jgi:hypothetical protein